MSTILAIIGALLCFLLGGFFVWLGGRILNDRWQDNRAEKAAIQESKKSFSVTAKVSIDGTFFWQIRKHPEGLIAHPAYVALFIQFTNEGNVSRMLDGYSVEAQDINGAWRSIRSVDPRIGRIVLAADPVQARLVNFGDKAFDHAIENKNLASHETITGWVLLGAIEEGLPADPKLRFKVKDTTGKEYVCDVAFPNPANRNGVDAQAAFVPTEGVIDISQIPKAAY